MAAPTAEKSTIWSAIGTVRDAQATGNGAAAEAIAQLSQLSQLSQPNSALRNLRFSLTCWRTGTYDATIASFLN
jgi:hypothetical protein